MKRAYDNDAIKCQYPLDFEVPFSEKYVDPSWKLSRSVEDVVTRILSHNDRDYLEHRMIFYKWATYHQIETCHKFSTNTIDPLKSSIYILKKRSRLLSSEVASVMPTILHEPSKIGYKAKKDLEFASLAKEIRALKDKLEAKQRLLNDLWKREVLYEEIYWALKREKEKQDEIVIVHD